MVLLSGRGALARSRQGDEPQGNIFNKEIKNDHPINYHHYSGMDILADEMNRQTKTAIALLNLFEGLEPDNKFGKQLPNWLTENHSGDCTNECHACSRCIAENYMKDAQKLLDFLDN